MEYGAAAVVGYALSAIIFVALVSKVKYHIIAKQVTA
jgi:hypothetical protein